MAERLQQILQSPFAPLLPWVAVALILIVVLGVVDHFGVQAAEGHRVVLEKEWGTVRQMLVQHREARKARQDVNQVWAVLPVERDFCSAGLGDFGGSQAGSRDVAGAFL